MTKNKLKIAMFISDTNAGGLETLITMLAKNIDREKFQVVVVTCGPGPVATRISKYGDEYHNLETGSFPRISKFRNDVYYTDIFAIPTLVLWMIKTTWRMYFWLRKNKIDLIHSHLAAFSLMAGIAGRIAGIPLIWHLHCPPKVRWSRGGPLLTGGYLASWVTTRFIAISRFIADQTHRSWKKKIVTVLNASDVKMLACKQYRGRLRKMANISQNEKLVGIVAVVSPRKGLPRFIEMAGEIANKRDDMKFVVIGAVDTEMGEKIFSDLAAMTEKLGISDKVRFIKNLESAANYLGDMDAFFMCSLPGTEPFGLVVTEAMAAGVPVVSFANDAMPEIIEDGKTGFLVPEGDTALAGERILQILNDDNLAAQIAEAAREKTYEKFDCPIFVNNIEKVYMEVSQKT